MPECCSIVESGFLCCCFGVCFLVLFCVYVVRCILSYDVALLPSVAGTAGAFVLMSDVHTSATLQKVSVIIVNHNAGSLLIDCARSSLAQAQQVIVVDNASSDSSLKELKAAFPQEDRLQVICADSNLGFSAGCNLGIKFATESVILFLNPDCVLEDSSIVRMGVALQAHSRVGMVGGFLMNPDGTEQAGSRRAIPTP